MDAHVRHADAFLAAVSSPPDRFLDLGSGGGVPGLILAIAWDCEVVLLDAQAKRGTFLREAVEQLGLQGSVVVDRAEVAGRRDDLRGAFSLVTSRGFGPPSATAECGGAFLGSDGVLVVAEPPDAPVERWAADGLAALGLTDLGVTATPVAHVRRLRRSGPLPDRYPRRAPHPAKRPLW